ncbi:MAG: hypothetical protein IT204_14005 [Fimbriimonadaceae bacterium]|nr:hypothetical protein [Fimbriimonadaceae bacterium]
MTDSVPAVVPAENTAVRARAVITALLIIPVNAFWVSYMEAIKYTGHPTTYSLFFNVVILLAVLLVINTLCARIGRAPFSRADLLVIYFMVALATALVGHDQAQVLIGVLAYPIFKATPENQWAIAFGERLPKYLIPRDTTALEAFFVGHASLWEFGRAWVVPLTCWGAFTLLLLFTLVCLNTIIRRQWVESERLTFPLVALPLEMIQPDLRFFRHRLMWVAFCIPCFINVVNNLNQWMPGVPAIQTRTWTIGQFLANRPWNAIGGTPMYIFPFAIGIGYLLPLDVLGSSWMFFLFWKAQTILAVATGFSSGHPNAPYVPEQAYGGYLGLAAVTIYAGRHHLRRVIACSFGRDPEYAASRQEGLPYPVAFWGFLVGFALLTWFAMRLRMDFWPVVALFVGYFGISLAVDRLRAEFGSPTHDLHNAYPGELLPRIFGPLSFSPATMTGFALFFWFNRAHRSHPMPIHLEGLVAGWRTGVNLRRLTFAMGLAAFVGIISAYVAVLQPHYDRGADSAKVWQLLRHFGNEAWGRLANHLLAPRRPEPASLVAMIIGFVNCVALFLLRIRMVGFPLHPVGLAVSSSWSMDQVWLSLFIAWGCKSAIIRAGGLKLFRAAVPFFLGLILGDFLSGGLFNIVGIFLDLPVYHFLG